MPPPQPRFTPIHRACWGKTQGHTETVKVLLEAGVPYDQRAEGRTAAGQTPLDMARDNQATRTLLHNWAHQRRKEAEEAHKGAEL